MSFITPNVTSATLLSAQKNQEFIIDEMSPYLANTKHLFEIASGTGFHACKIGERFPNLTVQTSDVDFHVRKEDGKTYLESIIERIAESKLSNVLPPVVFDANVDTIPGVPDVVFTSNSLHCMPWETAQKLIQKAADALKTDGVFIVYGPFREFRENYLNSFNENPGDGNRGFDERLKTENPEFALRVIDDVKEVARSSGLTLEKKVHHASANNFLFVFRKN